jgi:hypothetical protein
MIFVLYIHIPLYIYMYIYTSYMYREDNSLAGVASLSLSALNTTGINISLATGRLHSKKVKEINTRKGPRRKDGSVRGVKYKLTPFLTPPSSLPKPSASPKGSPKGLGLGLGSSSSQKSTKGSSSSGNGGEPTAITAKGEMFPFQKQLGFFIFMNIYIHVYVYINI